MLYPRDLKKWKRNKESVWNFGSKYFIQQEENMRNERKTLKEKMAIKITKF